MDNYINFIDFKSLKLADLANEIGDYQFAIENYNKVLNRLRYYQGDSMQPIMMAGEIDKKINLIKIKNGMSVLKLESWILSKSSFVKGNQCTKYLYLDKYKKQEKTPFTKEKVVLFKEGHNFEEFVRNTEFPGGVNIKDKVGNFAYFNSYTKHLLNSSSSKTIYEATIIEEDVLVMCDILLKKDDGNIHIYEIKRNKELNKAILADLAIQYTICKKRFGNKLKSFNLILRTEEENKNWKIENLADELEKQTDEVLSKINDYKMILHGNEPLLSMGDHCNKPYECKFIAYCKNM